MRQTMCALLCAVLLGMAADADPIARIHSEVAARRKEIAVPCARYWLTPPEGSTYYRALRGLSDVTIDFGGSELIGKVRTSMFDLDGCTNVTYRITGGENRKGAVGDIAVWSLKANGWKADAAKTSSYAVTPYLVPFVE